MVRITASMWVPFVKPYFVIGLDPYYIPESEVIRPSLRRRPASLTAGPGRGVKVAPRRRETWTP